MSPFLLGKPVAPWVVFAPEQDDFLSGQLCSLQAQGGRVVRIHASRLLQESELFSVFARELNFPSYFGHNWDALVDCLSDEHVVGHSPDGVVVVIENAELLHAAAHLTILVSVFAQAAERANLQLDSDDLPTGFPAVSTHFVFELRSTESHEYADLLRGSELIVQPSTPYLLITHVAD
jgi:RNAse (barnase) inhibitor barstar